MFSGAAKNLKGQRFYEALITQRLAVTTELAEAAQSLSSQLQVRPLTAKILLGRGLSSVEDIRAFLAPSLRETLPDPARAKNLEAAAELIAAVAREKGKIAVYSDFDVDGITAAAQLVGYLEAADVHVLHYVPSRFEEGYGVSRRGIEILAEQKVDLLVTVDCGVTNHDEIALAKKRGMKTIVIDHHQLHGESPADLVVDPAQPGCPFQDYKMCAAGIVWMLLILLRRKLVSEKELPDPKSFLDLAALGTICDMVPLVGPNRVIAARGLEALSRSERPGIIALKEVSKLSGKFSAGAVSFAIGPRINAAGRMGDAREAFELLITKDPQRARLIAQKIDQANLRRREIEDSVKSECVKTILKDEAYTSAAALSIFGETFHAGVIGIVAQRLVELFYRPSAVMAPGEYVKDGKKIAVLKGSVRSVKGFHVAENLARLKHLLLAAGGHSEAGGFTLLPENLAQFSAQFAELAAENLKESLGKRTVIVDAEIPFSELDIQIVDELARLAPFGMGNPSPMLATRDVAVESVTGIGEGHLKLRLNDGTYPITALAWNLAGHTRLKKGERINVAYSPETNTYGGMTSVQLNLKEIW